MIKDIINELANKKVPLAEPLLKLKIVAKRSRNENLYSIVSYSSKIPLDFCNYN